MGKLVSVIVPVYNVEKYLDRCIESILAQTYPNTEIILVDDKATDSSGEICDTWAQRIDKITVVHKEKNEGLGFARNTGIEHANGDYILFVDSDDYIAPELCEKAISRLENSNADICYFGHKKDRNGAIEESDLSALKDEYTGSEIVDLFLLNTLAQDINESGAARIGMSAWRILYKAETIKGNNLRFYSERDCLNEDLFFRIHVVKCIKKVSVIHENLYYYCYNGASLSTGYRKDRFEASKRMYQQLLEETRSFNDPKILTRCSRAFMNNLLVCIRQEIKYKNKVGSVADKRLKEYCNDPVVQQVLTDYPIKKMALQPRLLYSTVKNRWVAILKILVALKR